MRIVFLILWFRDGNGISGCVAMLELILLFLEYAGNLILVGLAIC